MKSLSWSLQTQILLLVLAVVFVAQALSLWIIVDERSLAVQSAIGSEAAGRAANVTRFIESTPPELHEQIVRAATSPLVGFELTSRPNVDHEHHDQGGEVKTRLRGLLADSFTREIRVEIHEIEQNLLPLPNLSPEMAELHEQMMEGSLAAIEMEISIALSNGRWLNVETRFERPPLQISLASNVVFGVIASVLLVASFWLLLARLTGPLNNLATAAERFGRGAADGPLPEVGPDEVRNLTHSFNTMQDRLTRFVSDRTLILASLAHDLRSPLTALRVRAELVEDSETRESLITSSNEMQDMVDATLDFAKGVGKNEVAVPTDIRAVVSDISEPELRCLSGEELPVLAKPLALRRALRNLIVNAITYGLKADISWGLVDGQAEIKIEDSGNGIPEDMLETVFDPYVRLETSRSRDTGGHGLGLSIARSIILAHGGSLKLTNLAKGGLRAVVRLPLASQNETASEQD